MKTIDKFILKSYLGPMFATFFIVMFILLMNVLWRYIDELVGKGLPFTAIVEMLFFMTSTMLPLGLPLATLLAAIMTMGNLGENNELLAFKAAGVSILRIMRSIIIVAGILSVLSFFIVNNYVLYSVKRVGNLLYDIRNQRQEIEFKDGVFFNGIPDISIRVGKQDPKSKLITDVIIYDTRDRKTTKTIVADSGYISLFDGNKYLKILLFDGQTYEDNRSYTWYSAPSLSHHQFDKQEILMPLEGFSFQESDKNLYANNSEAKSIVALGRDIDSLGAVSKISIDKTKNELLWEYIYVADTSIINHSDSVRAFGKRFVVSDLSIDTLKTDVKEAIFDQAADRLSSIKLASAMGHSRVTDSTVMLYRSIADWQKKLTLPVSVFIFFLIGAPLGAIIRKGGLGLPTIIALIVFVIYYILSLSSEKMVKDGAWSPALMWLTSFIFLPVALFLTYQAATDSKFLNIDSYYIFFDKYWTMARAKWAFVDRIHHFKFKRFKFKKFKFTGFKFTRKSKENQKNQN